MWMMSHWLRESPGLVGQGWGLLTLGSQRSALVIWGDLFALFLTWLSLDSSPLRIKEWVEQMQKELFNLVDTASGVKDYIQVGLHVENATVVHSNGKKHHGYTLKNPSYPYLVPGFHFINLCAPFRHLWKVRVSHWVTAWGSQLILKRVEVLNRDGDVIWKAVVHHSWPLVRRSETTAKWRWTGSESPIWISEYVMYIVLYCIELFCFMRFWGED